MSDSKCYEYTVITKENASECDADPTWFVNHPEWQVLLRSNHKWPGRRQWICAGGETVEQAKECLEESLRELVYKSEASVSVLDSETFVVMGAVLIGKESQTVIKD